MLEGLNSKIEVSLSGNEAFQNDYSSLEGHVPSAVIWPKSHQECIDVMSWANQKKIKIVIRGAGSGTTGGALARKNNVIVCLDKMNQILNLDTTNATITVEPGVIVQDIHSAVEAEGLFYPPDPASLSWCTIGGNVAENAGGPRALKYGVTRDYVIGLKGVWGSGETFSYGGKLKKNVAGYDLIGLLVGSEGTLGLITEITLKLIPKPGAKMEALASFDNSKEALAALINVKKLGVSPATAEFMIDTCIEAALNYTKESSLFEVKRAQIIWQFDGTTQSDVFEQLSMAKNMCGNAGWFPMDTKKTSDHVWSIRRNISLGLKEMAGKKYSEDIVVPISKVPEVIESLENIKHASGIRVLGYGHLGDGNIHVNILKMSASDRDWEKFSNQVIEDVMNLAVSVGGTISGEHGIGLTKKQFMPLIFSENDLAVMKKIRQVFDPNQLLNPGKVLDE